jgi:hypothetical protein
MANIKRLFSNSFFRGLAMFFGFAALMSLTSWWAGIGVPIFKSPPPCFDGLKFVNDVKTVCKASTNWESLLRGGVWLVYAIMFWRLVVRNSADFSIAPKTQLTHPDSNDSPVWLLASGLTMLAYILGVKVSFATWDSFLLYAPDRVLNGMVIALVASFVLIRGFTNIRSWDALKAAISEAHVNGAAILIWTGCLIGAFFA